MHRSRNPSLKVVCLSLLFAVQTCCYEHLPAERVKDLEGKAECKDVGLYNQTCLLHNAIYDPSQDAFYLFVRRRGAEDVKDLEVALIGLPQEPITVKLVPYEDDRELEEHMSSNRLWSVLGLTVRFNALWHSNWAHGFFDGLYATFVGLVKFGLQNEAYTTFVSLDSSLCPFDYRNAYLQTRYPACWVQEAYRLFGSIGDDAGVLLEQSHLKQDELIHFERIVLGAGGHGQYTSNVALPGSNTFFRFPYLPEGEGVPRLFVNRMYRAHGFPSLPPRRNARDDRRQILKLRAANVEPFSAQERAAQKAAIEQLNSNNQSGEAIDAKVINWEEIQPFRKQLEVIRETDIFLSGPGTGQFYSLFLPDGAVQVNLGAQIVKHSPTFAEEMLGGSNVNIRALYMDPKSVMLGYSKDEVISLVMQAVDAIRSGFKIPLADPKENLSVFGKIILELMQRSPEARAGLTGEHSSDHGYACHMRPTGQTSVSDLVFEFNTLQESGEPLSAACGLDLALLRQLKRAYGLKEALGVAEDCDCVVCATCGNMSATK